jgi:hypothetical protein
MQEVEYCGHVINDKGTTFSADKITEIVDFSVPENHGGLKSFLGMAGYMREHVDHYVDLVHPLQQIVAHYSKRTRRTKIEWTPEHLQAFDNVKNAIAELHTLYHRDDSAPLRLYTDASSYGIGAYLCQVVQLPSGITQEQPIGFISKSLSVTERRWSVYEKEAYAIFYACKKWEHFLRGHHFHLFTDHKNLTFLNRPPSEKVMRWRLAIQEFGFSVAYIKGEKNNVADALSRCLPNPKDDSDVTQPSHPLRHTTLDFLMGRVMMPPKIPSVPDTWYEATDRESRKQYFIPTEEYSSFLGLLDGLPGDIVPQSPLRVTDCELCPPHVRCEQLPYCLLCPVTADKHELVSHEEDPCTHVNQ